MYHIVTSGCLRVPLSLLLSGRRELSTVKMTGVWSLPLEVSLLLTAPVCRSYAGWLFHKIFFFSTGRGYCVCRFLKLRQPLTRIPHNRNINKYTNMRHENCVLLGYYAASSGNSLPTFGDILSVPSSRVKNKPEERSSSTSRRKPEITRHVACLLVLFSAAGALWQLLTLLGIAWYDDYECWIASDLWNDTNRNLPLV